MYRWTHWRNLLLACGVLAALAQSVAAQPALERLEKKLGGDAAAVDPPPVAPAERGYLGIVTEDERGRGALVAEVARGGPAEAAGVQPGDLIIAVGRDAVRGNEDLAAVLRAAPPGAKLAFDVVRTTRAPGAEPQSETVRLDVTLGRRAAEPARAAAYLGVLTRPVDAATRAAQRMPSNRGAVISEVVPDSPAAQAGLRAGDVIVALGGVTVNSPAELHQRVAAQGAGDEVELLLYRGGQLQRQAVALGAAPVPQPEPPPAIGPGPAPPPPAIAAPGNGSRQRIEALEQRVRELERRLAELEKKLAGQAP